MNINAVSVITTVGLDLAVELTKLCERWLNTFNLIDFAISCESHATSYSISCEL
jgi:hypothetical protein